jgi:hypothetical protein
MLRNNEAKRLLGYTDAKSLVRFDGSECLHGKDWLKRKKELWERANGRCEHRAFGQLAARCPNDGHDPHHVKPRHPKRDDRLKNLQLLCRFHHRLLDKRKTRFGEHLEIR